MLALASRLSTSKAICEDEPGPIAIEDKRDSQATPDTLAATSRARAFLISVAKGTSGLDLDQLRTVRERAWR